MPKRRRPPLRLQIRTAASCAITPLGSEHRRVLAEQRRRSWRSKPPNQRALPVQVVLDPVRLAPGGERAEVVGGAAGREVGDDERAASPQFAAFGGRGRAWPQ